LGKGAIALKTSVLSLKCDMKHCSMNSRHRYMGAKSGVLWPSKYAKMWFRAGRCPRSRWCSSRRSPDTVVGWGRNPSPYFTPSWRLDSPAFGAHHSQPSVSRFGGGGNCPRNVFVYSHPCCLYTHTYKVSGQTQFEFLCHKQNSAAV